MATGLLHLHNALRWVILLLLLVNIIRLLIGQKGLLWSKLLLISSHITLLLGLYQWYFSEKVGVKLFMETMGSFGNIMKDSFARYWAVEHLTGMLAAIIIITVGHVSLKKGANTKRVAGFYITALILILIMIPWPFREMVGRPWFPGM
ncbi:MAG: hypothetical protein MUF12_04260 [Sediminibacterium sp.]|jgi:hypothetical protein|nr:hypothetical protein [Sediminibacterium sp.]